MSPEPGKTNGILNLPRSLQQIVDSMDYPPGRGFITNETLKVVMIVDVVSPTPYALLRRAKNFEYRDSDRALQDFANRDDPVQSLTDECRRVLNAISSTNQSHISNAKTSTSLSDPSWSRFEDIGFSSALDEIDEDNGFLGPNPSANRSTSPQSKGQYSNLARPTTPSWADFLSSGFVDENGKAAAPILLPPDKILPPISTAARGQSSQSHRRNLDVQPNQDPGELASIANVAVDDAFWWVWISSLAGEEPTSRKAVFGRCAFIETVSPNGGWMVMEEQVQGAAPEPAAGAYIAEKKKSFFGFTTKRGRLTRRRSGIKKGPMSTTDVNGFDSSHRATLAPDQEERIQQAASALSRRKRDEEEAQRRTEPVNNVPASNRNSVFTLGPVLKDEASPAMQWVRQHDKKEVRAKYLGDSFAGKGSSQEMLTLPSNGVNRSTSTLSSTGRDQKELPAPPQEPSRAPPAPREITPEPTPEPVPEFTAAAPAPPVTIVEPAPMPPEPETAAPAPPSLEAVKAPLPPPTPEPVEAKPVVSSVPTQSRVAEVTRPSSSTQKKLRKSQDAGRRSPEQKKGRPPGPPPVQKTGIRRLFGTKRSRSREPEPAQSKQAASPKEVSPAVAAARRALEGQPALSPTGTASPPLSPGHFQRTKGAKSPIAAVQTVQQPPRPSTPPQQRVFTPEHEPHKAEDDEVLAGPPRNKRDDEYDALSRVDTNEQEHAEREFSTFDQGPLVDQPAFAPRDSTPVEYSHEEPKHRPAHQSTYSAVTVPVEESDEEDEDEEDGEQLTKQTSPQDRWAQIRKNAADRAARQSEEQTTRSRTETRTDDGETSGEESESFRHKLVSANTKSSTAIESRVARIKARVAELTGNMEATRR